MKVSSPRPPARFLPMSRAEMSQLGWDEIDILLVTGDAYVDHPSFGAAVIGRVLEAAGYRVGIIAQPDWRDPEAFAALGRPRLFAGVTAGAMDSMLANLTANKKVRNDDAYSPGGKAGRRPNYPSIVYTNMLRQVFKDLPIVLGGIEASLRRFAHYDYWKDSIRRSILLDSKANLIVAGMGELQVVEIAQRLEMSEEDWDDALRAIPGTVEVCNSAEFPEEIRPGAVMLPSYEDVLESKKDYLKAALQLEEAVARRLPAQETGEGGEKEAAFSFRTAMLADDDFVPDSPPIIQHQGDRMIVEWPPRPMTPRILDAIYALPFQRKPHPSYQEHIPAIEPVRFSVTTHRGCFGGCTFCALTLHQGRHVVCRSEESVLNEVQALTKRSDFKGTIPDAGGPTANMYGMRGRDLHICGKCRRPSCTFPGVCTNLNASHAAYTRLLERALRIPGIKHLFIASGIRYDLLTPRKPGQMPADARAFFKLLVDKLTGGHMSVAPEHASARVLQLMRKPDFEVYRVFEEIFEEESAGVGKQQYLIPYFIAGFPGSCPEEIAEVKRYLRSKNRKLRQIQDFVPAPMTIASALYYSEMEPGSYRKLHVPKSAEERREERETLTLGAGTGLGSRTPGGRASGSRATGRKSEVKRPGKPGGKPKFTEKGSDSKSAGKDKTAVTAEKKKAAKSAGGMKSLDAAAPKSKKGWAKAKPKAKPGVKKSTAKPRSR